MTRKVFCKKLKKDLKGLGEAPYPGDLGDEIYNHISKEAWDLWLDHQTMIINENRLNLADENARKTLEKTMIKFLFQDDEVKPAGYVAPE